MIWFFFLYVLILCLQLALGSTVALAFQGMIPTRWMVPLLPAFRRQTLLLVPAAVLAIVLFAFRSQVFPWVAHPPEGSFARWYYSDTPFAVREFAVFAVWTYCIWRLLRGRTRGSAGIIVAVLWTGTFAAADWILSLDPQWKSTVFEVLWLESGLLVAMALAILRSTTDAADLRQDQSSVHYSLIAVWTYLVTMQFLVIWYANLPPEASWLVLRQQAPWSFILHSVIVVQCVIPLVLLLFRPLKRSPRVTCSLAIATLIAQASYAAWLIFPLSGGAS